MTQSPTVDIQRSMAEQHLFSARRALTHLVEMYDSGQWRHYYRKEEVFAEAVREARHAVEHWTDIFNSCERASAHDGRAIDSRLERGHHRL